MFVLDFLRNSDHVYPSLCQGITGDLALFLDLPISVRRGHLADSDTQSEPPMGRQWTAADSGDVLNALNFRIDPMAAQSISGGHRGVLHGLGPPPGPGPLDHRVAEPIVRREWSGRGEGLLHRSHERPCRVGLGDPHCARGIAAVQLGALRPSAATRDDQPADQRGRPGSACRAHGRAGGLPRWTMGILTSRGFGRPQCNSEDPKHCSASIQRISPFRLRSNDNGPSVIF